jgi:hypothetical protein
MFGYSCDLLFFVRMYEYKILSQSLNRFLTLFWLFWLIYIVFVRAEAVTEFVNELKETNTLSYDNSKFIVTG